MLPLCPSLCASYSVMVPTGVRVIGPPHWNSLAVQVGLRSHPYQPGPRRVQSWRSRVDRRTSSSRARPKIDLEIERDQFLSLLADARLDGGTEAKVRRMLRR